MVVKQRRSRVECVAELDEARFSDPYARFWIRLADRLRPFSGRITGATRLRLLLETIGRPDWGIRSWLGHQDLSYSSSYHLLDHIPVVPDVVHCHNLHGGYFDLDALPALSLGKPVFLTLHDEWLLTGHCAYSIDCDRWKSGCGNCPDLTLPPPVRRDATARNWERKRSVYRSSRLHVAAPSQWLCDEARLSILAEAAAEIRVIHNGVDLEVFRPGDKSEARHRTSVPEDAFVLLFVGQKTKQSPFKDYETLRNAVLEIAKGTSNKRVVFVALGESAPAERIGAAEIRHAAFTADPAEVALYYQAADVYIHAARSDNFPTTILEALACGVPVVATAVGGIPEQLDEGVTGHLVPPSDSRSMADAVSHLMNDEPARAAMSRAAAEVTELRFDQQRMVDTYVNWYSEVISGQARDDRGG